jgi:steroid 5-alpha reductase family enzyme
VNCINVYSHFRHICFELSHILLLVVPTKILSKCRSVQLGLALLTLLSNSGCSPMTSKMVCSEQFSKYRAQCKKFPSTGWYTAI